MTKYSNIYDKSIFPCLFKNKRRTSTWLKTDSKMFLCVEMTSISYHHISLKKWPNLYILKNTILKIPFFHLYTSALTDWLTFPMLSYIQLIQNLRFKPYNYMFLLQPKVFEHLKNLKLAFLQQMLSLKLFAYLSK